jgi:uncharacterized protein YyaL (SSP411 family)
MLYDNAQLVHAYLPAWQVTKEPSFKRIVVATLNFVARELTHPAGGFFDTSKDNVDLLLRPKDLQDDATPSGNALAGEALLKLAAAYRPNMMVAASPYPPSDDAPPLLLDRPLKQAKATAYVCEGLVCKMPVNTVLDLQGLL